MKCRYSLCVKEVEPTYSREYCSKRCGVKDHVKRWRKRTKLKAIEYKGGKCCRCGYSKCPQALEFHHLDPTKKDFGIGSTGSCKAWEKIKVELDKCILICSNCHREEHAKALDDGLDP